MTQPVVPMWPRDTNSLRVLVECEDPTVQDGLERALRTAGHATATCAGPMSRSSGQCPLVVGGRCGLVEDADVVVQSFDLERSDLAQVFAAIRSRCPNTPVIVETAGGTDGPVTTAAATCHTLRYPTTATAVVDTVHTITTVRDRRRMDEH
jgi:hypothetical protein